MYCPVDFPAKTFCGELGFLDNTTNLLRTFPPGTPDMDEESAAIGRAFATTHFQLSDGTFGGTDREL